MNGKEIRNVKENKKEKGKECQKKTPRGGVIVANDVVRVCLWQRV